ncbi:MAG: hypothetical protein WC509_07730 [Candidatus Izemoplasmatales bacterium]
MIDFLRRVVNTDFLPMNEVRKIKVVLIMTFLLIVTAATVGFAFSFVYDDVVTIVVMAVFVLGAGFIYLLIRFNRIMAAIHVTIVYTIALMMFYTQGTDSFYAYLFFYISLSVIVFYQELYIYLTYGTAVAGYGVFYILMHADNLLAPEDIPGSIYAYVVLLLLFYVIFLIQSLHNEKLYTDLNLEWVKLNQVIGSYQDFTLYHLEEIRKREKGIPFYEDRAFRKAVDELSVFVCEQLKEHGKDITNVLDLYIYIHERGLAKIIDNEELSTSTKKIANRLDKYLLNRRTDMVSILMNFFTRFRTSEPYRPNRYEYHLGRLAPATDEQIVALAFVYRYLANEPSAFDAWGEPLKTMSHEEICQLFAAPEMEEFLSDGQVAFFKENADLFRDHLGRKG